MADEARIKQVIREIAQRRKNVTLDEISWVVRNLGQFFEIAVREARHGILFRVHNQRFLVNTHNPGSKQVKAYSVDDFLDAMVEIGWFEE